MDKTTGGDDKKEQYPIRSVHHLPRGIRQLHEDYGLWVCRCAREVLSKPREQMKEARKFEFHALSHMFSGDGFYWTPGGEVVSVRPGQLVVVTRGSPHNYGGVEEIYSEDTVNFVGPLADRLVRCGILQDGVYDIGEARRLLPIIELAMDPSDSSQLQANTALQSLLVEVHLEHRAYGYRHDRIAGLLAQLAKTIKRWWTVEEMAEYCQLSPSRFRVVFEQSTGMRPKRYLDQLKLQGAAEKLVGSSLSVAEVAAMYGYQDPFHFSRRFKALMGFAPTAYREEMRR